MANWPTSGLVDSTIQGQLAWPVPSTGFSGGAASIPNANARSNILTASASGRYLDIGNKLYEKTAYIGLRGVFRTDKEEDLGGISSLRRYPLWRWIGYAPGPAETQADIDEIDGLHTDFKNAEKESPEESGLSDKRNMYFFDGVHLDGVSRPRMTLYYRDGQGRESKNAAEVGIDFYQMKYAGSAPESSAAARTLETAGESSQQLQQGGSWGRFGPTSTFEAAAGGPPATEIAYQNVYAEVLAWNRLSGGSTNESHLEPLLSLYATMREQMMAAAGDVLENALGHIGGQFMDPDKSQATISAKIESRLRDEGFSAALIDFFMTKENVSTITPEGYERYRWDQSLRAIPAGTPANQIQGRNTPQGNTNVYTGLSSGGLGNAGGTAAVNNITVVGPVFHIRAPNAEDVTGYGPDGFTQAKLVQEFPEGYDFAGYTFRTLSTVEPAREEFTFPYTPNDIQYQGLGAKWVEVPRTGDLPLLEFSQWTLMKVSMEFIIANIGDGLRTSVYDQLEKLRRIAQRPFPVSIFGLDQMLRVSMKRAEVTGKPLEFVIGDLSVSSMQRTIQRGDKEITSARVKLTLQEIPIEESNIHHFRRPIVIPVVNPPDGDEGGERVDLAHLEVFRAAEGAGGETDEFKINPNVGGPSPMIFSVNPPAVVAPPTADDDPMYNPEA